MRYFGASKKIGQKLKNLFPNILLHFFGVGLMLWLNPNDPNDR